MEYTILNNGIYMPLFGLGTWDLRGPECVRTVQKSVEYGYRLIDIELFDFTLDVSELQEISSMDCKKSLFGWY